MLPTEADVAQFTAVAPCATRTAIMFLAGADTVNEAVSQYFENPMKYGQDSATGASGHQASTKDMYGYDSKETFKNQHDASSTMEPLPRYQGDSDTKNPMKQQLGTFDSKDPSNGIATQPATTSSSSFSPPSYPPPSNVVARAHHVHHTNDVVAAGKVRARDEQEMQNLLQNVQYQNRIYNSDIEPEHDTDYYCNCSIHQYKRMKFNRLGVQNMWSKAVMYPGEKAYNDVYQTSMFSGNPYTYRVISPYNRMSNWGGLPQLSPRYHEQSVLATVALNVKLNNEAQASIDAKEPASNIWAIDELGNSMSKMGLDAASTGDDKGYPNDKNNLVEKDSGDRRRSMAGTPLSLTDAQPGKPSKGLFKRFLPIKSTEEKATRKVAKMQTSYAELRASIETEENGRWPDAEWRQIVATYQEKVGMTSKIADLRARQPIQYLHLLRAGYFEPIPVAWATLASNPLKFSIDSAAGWRGITPTWRGFEDTAEERLYWVLNHREGTAGVRMKPDIMSEMKMARDRMATAVEPPPVYFSEDDTCHLQHTSEGYSKQVMPSPFRPFDKPETPSDDTMILLDVSGSMDFDPVRPNYDRYLITGYSKSTQPKNKDVAKAIIRRFTDAMANHDHTFKGYQMTTFSSQANYIGSITHKNLDQMWQKVKLGGGTRVMTGWQKVKELHFQKHSESATHHPVYGWQAGPQTPILRLLLLLDGEATDMDEFELDLLGLSWVHVTIFLIGVDGCPHHHRHANELSRISQVNHHVSFVDAQGNTPERFVTHELLKRHLGYDVSMSEFIEMEQPPTYVR